MQEIRDSVSKKYSDTAHERISYMHRDLTPTETKHLNQTKPNIEIRLKERFNSLIEDIYA